MSVRFPYFVRHKTCPRCGAQFGCGPQTPAKSCWCDALPHIVPMPQDGDCFCPACLAAICEGRQSNAESRVEPRESQ